MPQHEWSLPTLRQQFFRRTFPFERDAAARMVTADIATRPSAATRSRRRRRGRRSTNGHCRHCDRVERHFPSMSVTVFGAAARMVTADIATPPGISQPPLSGTSRSTNGHCRHCDGPPRVQYVVDQDDDLAASTNGHCRHCDFLPQTSRIVMMSAAARIVTADNIATLGGSCCSMARRRWPRSR